MLSTAFISISPKISRFLETLHLSIYTVSFGIPQVNSYWPSSLGVFVCLYLLNC